MPKNTKIVLKNKKIKKKNISNKIILDKVNRLIEIVENTIIYVQKYKTMDIITAGQVNSCLVQLENLFTKILIIADSVKKVNNDYEALIYLGRCKLNIHDYEQAILVFNKLLKIKIHPEVYRFRAICKLELLLIESAKEDLLIAIDLKDNESNFIFELFYGTNK